MASFEYSSQQVNTKSDTCERHKREMWREQRRRSEDEESSTNLSESSDLSTLDSADEIDDAPFAQQDKLLMLDPSEHLRPEHQQQQQQVFDTHGKSLTDFRVYSDNDDDYIQRRVKRTYYLMHKNQTVEFVRQRISKWTRFDHAQLTIMEALVKLNALIDESDPDNDLPNIVHAFQTAERLREVHPNKDWLHLTGLIHDLGKVMALWGEHQWAVVGDTYVVGCQFANSIVYRDTSFVECVDLYDSRYNTKFGIYKPNCGLDNVLFSWGHDEYMARVLRNHKRCKLPKQAIDIIRLHSFYPWHTGGDYMHLCTNEDLETMKIIREFNKFDLYTKSAPVPDIERLMPYYQSLIDKYIPGKLNW